MCEELSAGAVMTDGAVSLFHWKVIKSQITRGRVAGEREVEQIFQMIREISQSGDVSDDGKCYFLPVQFGVRGQWGVKSTTSDLTRVKSETRVSQLLIRIPLSVQFYLLDMFCWVYLQLNKLTVF